MQRVLEKMAKQLNEYDEASLMQLWQQYASRVHDFEPTKRWEEAALILCLVQAVHWKNQLFNYHLAASAAPADKSTLPPLPDYFSAQRAKSGAQAPTKADESQKAKATVLRFPEKSGNAPTAAAPTQESGPSLTGGQATPWPSGNTESDE